jgi:D-amino-acid dehydrogenase
MVFCTPMNGFVRFAGTLEFSGVNYQIRRPRLENLTSAARLYLNSIVWKALSSVGVEFDHACLTACRP